MDNWSGSLYDPPVYSITPNIRDIPIDASMVGLYYAYEASGGYLIDQRLNDIVMIPYERINQYDITQAVQILFDVRTFNEKIRLFKDANNTGIIDSSHNPTLNSFPINDISLSSIEFLLGTTVENVCGEVCYFV